MFFWKNLSKIWSLIIVIPQYKYLLLLQVIAGFANILSFPLLIPVLDLVKGEDIATNNFIIDYLIVIIQYLGLPINIGILLAFISLLVLFSLFLNSLVIVLAQFEQYKLFERKTLVFLDAYLSANWSWIMNTNTGEINHALYSEAASWSETGFQALKVLSTVIQAATLLLVAFVINTKATLIVFIIISAIMIVNAYLTIYIKRQSRSKNAEQQVFSEFVQSVQQNRKFLKTCPDQDSINAQVKAITGSIVKKAKNISFRNQLISLWTQSGGFVSIIILILFYDYIGFTYSELLVILLVMLQLLPKFLAIANAYSAFSISYPIYTSFNDRLNQSISNFESYGSADFKFDSPIVFNNISFSHHKSSPILQDLSFSIPMNKTICIVGKSGAGKSTVLDLLTGLIIPHSGSISYGSIDNSQVNYSKLRSDIAYVGQETTLFPGTILENLVFRCSHVSYQEVIEVCEMVQISDFVNDLPLGLNTKVGENGISLSGGQRQRLALGRALKSSKASFAR